MVLVEVEGGGQSSRNMIHRIVATDSSDRVRF